MEPQAAPAVSGPVTACTPCGERGTLSPSAGGFPAVTLGRCRPERVPTTRVPRGPGGPEDVAGRCSDACQAACASPSPPGATVRRRFSPAEASGSGQGGAAQTGTSVTRVRFAFRRGARVPAPGPASTPRASRPLPRLLGVVFLVRSLSGVTVDPPVQPGPGAASGGGGEAPVKRGLLLGGREREAGRQARGVGVRFPAKPSGLAEGT